MAAHPTKQLTRNNSVPAPTPPSTDPEVGDICVAGYDYEDKAADRLEFKKGEEISLDAIHPGNWGYGQSLTTKKSGYFPLKFTVKKEQPKKSPPPNLNSLSTFSAPLPPPLTLGGPSPRPPGAGPSPTLASSQGIPAQSENQKLPFGLKQSSRPSSGSNRVPDGYGTISGRSGAPQFGRSGTVTGAVPGASRSPPGVTGHPVAGGHTIPGANPSAPVGNIPNGVRSSQSFSQLDDSAPSAPSPFSQSAGTRQARHSGRVRPASSLDATPGHIPSIHMMTQPAPGGQKRARRLSADYAISPSNNADSIVNNKKQTRNVLDAWLKTKRPDIEELQKRGILSTGGNIEGIQFAKKGIMSSKKELIGMPLEELLEAVPGRTIPFVVDQCVTYIRRNAMTLHGVFRVSPNQQELSKLKALYKSPLDVVDLEKKVKDPHVVAGLLKLFLSSLPEPLFPHTLYEPLIKAFGDLFDQENPQPLIDEFRILLRLIPNAHAPLVRFLFEFLEELQQQSEKNMMTPSNLGIVFGPNLIKPAQQTQETMLNMTNRDIVSFLVTHFKEIWAA
mmetsp:Transcript_38448/g.60921  ORF Transcript_38448/g.60921 Transcript_38448/m.60921 type:complete len:559 (-) Transcript_38448:222-1898(-)|eukprot:CAMPEP_0201539530 /NCGR_PEP_ID=MMETSP0161_2-20130828/70459_1 /ASSEMBLY_ACC=CAM_ASM_000251 /TAXON_ID=180227 /ORGANISM="Neoparamoeba aestuarina, Strain SoJaBio B1-5/56/2" /LENGTH=558 /DNA_ID=CAMNT_0047946935 /DNA_START=121 /DNA_END=1797 /DNA_ORIENTATION=-